MLRLLASTLESAFDVRDWPALAAGIIVAAYWGRVAKMAWKQRRRTGRAANFIPGEPLGRLLRFIWIPIVLIWILQPLASAWMTDGPMVMRAVAMSPWARWPAVVGMLAALLATRACWKRMGKSWRMGIDPAEQTALIMTGPYAYVRHPIYALSAALMICTVIVIPSPLMAATAVIHIFLLQWEARREERHLSDVHGASYDRYRVGVGRFVPRFRRSTIA